MCVHIYIYIYILSLSLYIYIYRVHPLTCPLKPDRATHPILHWIRRGCKLTSGLTSDALLGSPCRVKVGVTVCLQVEESLGFIQSELQS